MKKLFTSLFLLGMIAPFGASAQLQLKAEAPANPDNEPIEVHPVPSSTSVKVAGDRVLRLLSLWYEHLHRPRVG